MDKFWMTFGLLSLLAALVPWPVQAQPLAQRRTLLVGLGAALAFLFLLFVLMVVYALWCGESLDSNKEKEKETMRKEEKEAKGDWGLELEDKEEPPNYKRIASSSS